MDKNDREDAVEELRKSNQRLELLVETAGQLLKSDSPQDVVDMLCRKVLLFLDCDAFFNFLVDDDMKRLHLNSCGGIPEEAVRRLEWLDYGVGLCGCSARDGCRLVVNNLQHVVDPYTELVRPFGIQAYACHPLISQGRVLGTLSFCTRNRTSFTDDELSLMKIVADQVAIAINRKRTEEELRRARDELEIRVAERTRELKITNNLLLEEIAERVRIDEKLVKLNEDLEQIVEERTAQLIGAREELVRKEKLAVLGQLAGSVGHELRNPLGVMGNAIYYLNTILTDGDAVVKDYLDIIKCEIDNSRHIISDLLDFARIKPPRTELAKVNDLITQSLGRCTIPEDVKLHLDLPESLAVINVDPLQIMQVLQNLITNAVEAMPDGGTLSISAEPDRQTGTFKIRVDDTGVGISREHLEKLFQPLFTTKQRGIGLGLTISRNLTEANGGRIEVASRWAEGTTFTLTLPGRGNSEELI
jgi:signal transduction histidine kinase